jgi:hypothetical protein
VLPGTVMRRPREREIERRAVTIELHSLKVLGPDLQVPLVMGVGKGATAVRVQSVAGCEGSDRMGARPTDGSPKLGR